MEAKDFLNALEATVLINLSSKKQEIKIDGTRLGILSLLATVYETNPNVLELLKTSIELFEGFPKPQKEESKKEESTENPTK